MVGYMTGPEGDGRVDVTCDPGTAFNPATGSCDAMAGAPGGSTEVGARHVNRRFRHFGDLVLIAKPHPDVTLSFNADIGANQVISNPVTGAYRNGLWYGSTLTLRYAIASKWAAAVRGDFLHDVNGFTTGVDGLMVGSARSPSTSAGAGDHPAAREPRGRSEPGVLPPPAQGSAERAGHEHSGGDRGDARAVVRSGRGGLVAVEGRDALDVVGLGEHVEGLDRTRR